jgi:hypothetical protein
MLTQDYSNCRHLRTERRGFSKGGKQRVSCCFCGRKMTIGSSRRFPSLADIREIAVLCVDGAETQKQVAARLGLTPSTVGKWACRIRKMRAGLMNAPAR